MKETDWEKWCKENNIVPSKKTKKDMFLCEEKCARSLLEEVFDGERNSATIKRITKGKLKGSYEVILRGLPKG